MRYCIVLLTTPLTDTDRDTFPAWLQGVSSGRLSGTVSKCGRYVRVTGTRFVLGVAKRKLGAWGRVVKEGSV